MTGIAIRAMTPVFPGDGVRGKILTTQEVLDSTYGKDNVTGFQRRAAAKIEEASGIKTRNIVDPGLKDPNTYLAAAAAHKLLKKLDM